jgi:hypothetical protein
MKEDIRRLDKKNWKRYFTEGRILNFIFQFSVNWRQENTWLEKGRYFEGLRSRSLRQKGEEE